MIPKIIHYCWFGGNDIPKEHKKHMRSWKKHCPNFQFIEWNESNYDVTKHSYMKEAYLRKKYAFVSDYARLDIIYEHGGIFFDTDVEIVKALDDLLINDAFMGIERDNLACNTGNGFGAIKGHKTIKALRDCHDNIDILKEDGTFNLTTCTYIQTEWLSKAGYLRENKLQNIAGVTIYPYQYFSPNQTCAWGGAEITSETYSIHHYAFSWVSDEEKRRRAEIKSFKKFFGTKIGRKLYNAKHTYKAQGLWGLFKKIYTNLRKI
jgi:hypothetical protein